MKHVLVVTADRTWPFGNCTFDRSLDGVLTITDIQHKAVVAVFPAGCWTGVINQEVPDEKPLTPEERLGNPSPIDDLVSRAS